MDNKTYFHLCAFRGSVTNGTTNTAIAGVNDNILSRSSANNFLAPRGTTIRFASGGGVNASRQRINTPVVREIGLPYIAPIGTGTTIQAPPNIAEFGPYGPKPADADEISVEATHTDAAPQVQWCLMGLTFARREWTPGVKIRIRLTASITGVIGSWASGTMTPDQNLPSGIYQVQGMDAFGANLLGARMIFAGGGWRPGVIARNTLSSQKTDFFQDGRLGVFGEFDSVNTPQLEVYCEAANTSQEVFLDVVRVADR